MHGGAGPRSSGIYRIRNRDNGKYYIGSAQDIRKRWASHRRDLRGRRHRNQYLQASWNKHGEEAFCFEVLEFCKTADLLNREQAYLDTRCERCFNISPTAGTCRGIKRTPEQRKRCSEILIGHKRVTQEMKEAARRRLQGNKYWVGRTHSVESREKLRIAHLTRWESRPQLPKFRKEGVCRKDSPEFAEKCRQSNLGRKHTEESKRKMSERAKGRKHSEATRLAMTGRKLSEETRARMREGQARRRMRESGWAALY